MWSLLGLVGADVLQPKGLLRSSPCGGEWAKAYLGWRPHPDYLQVVRRKKQAACVQYHESLCIAVDEHLHTWLFSGSKQVGPRGQPEG